MLGFSLKGTVPGYAGISNRRFAVCAELETLEQAHTSKTRKEVLRRPMVTRRRNLAASERLSRHQ